MKFLKKNKKIVIGVAIAVAILLVVFLVKILIFPTFGKDRYGNRLDGIEQVRINQDSMTKMEQELSTSSSVENVNTDVKGRIVNIMIEVKAGTKVEDAKKLANQTLEHFTGDQKEYYDIQVFLTSSDENYPYIGYKHKTSKEFKWTNN